jgi:biopolymer transport protein ExbB
MESQMGLAHFWNQGDLVTHTTAIILALALPLPHGP